MIPRRVSLENFLSFGEPATEILFSDDEPLWVLGGPNGVGKSAVFDAITYCLFGQHRGGKLNAEQLIRHGANGFKVIFEFEINGIVYRVTRSRYGRTTQKVEQRMPDTGAWAPVAGINSATDVGNWTERTIGLGFDAFKASVLLRQGEADEIINASGSRRLEILKRIIEAERYEALSERVRTAYWKCKSRLETLQDRRDHLPQISDDDLTAAQDSLVAAEGVWKQAHEDLHAALERIAGAKRWTELEASQRSIKEQLHAADERAAEAQQIRDNKARLDELTATLPTLHKVIELRERLKQAGTSLLKLEKRRTTLFHRQQELTIARDQTQQKAASHATSAEESARNAKRLREEIQRDRNGIAAADDVKNLQKELQTFPADLQDRYTEAREAAKKTIEALTQTGNRRAEVETLLRQARHRQQEFADVGAKCSRCGQTVDEEHAYREQQAIAADVARYDLLLKSTTEQIAQATTARSNAETERDRLLKLQQEQQFKTQQLADREKLLHTLGLTTDADTLREQLAAKTNQADRDEQQAAHESSACKAATEETNRLNNELKSHTEECAELERQIRDLTTAHANDSGQHVTLSGQLPPLWRDQAESLTTDLMSVLEHELQTLNSSDVAERFRQLQDDSVRREGLARNLDALQSEIASIPETARLSITEAESAAKEARMMVADADQKRDTARTVADRLTRQASEFQEIVRQIAEAETETDTHKRLDELLGKSGLQRELVRAAERGIVHHANATVQNLSSGDLSIELEEEPDGTDKALTLHVRRAEDSMPIPVMYLSGSQKFRVSVAIALAIGQYAAGQNRRLECVIIDEGFGSLDPDGLNAMATELNRLREHLKRIVLVSHQEEFADRFPVVIRLTHGEHGTIAESIRR